MLRGGGLEAAVTSLQSIMQSWFVFTTLLLVCTLKSTLAFFSLFFTLDLAFLSFAISYIRDLAEGNPHHGMTIAAGVFGLLAALFAWYNALAGLADTSNRCVDPGSEGFMGALALAEFVWTMSFPNHFQSTLLTCGTSQLPYHSRCKFPLV